MRITVGGALGIVGAILPLVYIAGSVRQFTGVGGKTVRGTIDLGLDPTILGLALLGLLFSLPLIVKLRRLVSNAGSARTTASEAEGFDPDAALANYLRSHARDAIPEAPVAADATEEPRPFSRPGGFGRKIV